MKPVDVKIYFNFRSPYCYLASKTMWQIVDDYHVNLVWKPVGGWNLRSEPDRAKIKIPLVRQDLTRFARRMGIPVNPPPMETEPTPAGAASLFAQAEGKLREYVVETMRIEWAEGQNIAEDGVLAEVGSRIGLDPDTVVAASRDDDNLAVLASNAGEAVADGIFGVPSFVIGEDVFWGQDRLDFVLDQLREMRAARL